MRGILQSLVLTMDKTKERCSLQIYSMRFIWSAVKCKTKQTNGRKQNKAKERKRSSSKDISDSEESHYFFKSRHSYKKLKHHRSLERERNHSSSSDDRGSKSSLKKMKNTSRLHSKDIFDSVELLHLSHSRHSHKKRKHHRSQKRESKYHSLSEDQDAKLEKIQYILSEFKKLEKAAETPDEKMARRLAEKKAKEQKRKGKMSSNKDYVEQLQKDKEAFLEWVVEASYLRESEWEEFAEIEDTLNAQIPRL